MNSIDFVLNLSFDVTKNKKKNEMVNNKESVN